MDTLFVKIERLRRLHKCKLKAVKVQRGEDGTFGLGLSEDNVVFEFHHPTNDGVLQKGDQIRYVEHVQLVRERLRAVIAREFAEVQTLTLHISRSVEKQPTPISGEVFSNLKLLRHDGTAINECPSELWRVRPEAVWGACWTLPLPRATRAISLNFHRSLLLTDPLVGAVQIPLGDIPPDQGGATTRWVCLTSSRWLEGEEALGEVLLTMRRYINMSSVSPRAANDEDLIHSDEEPEEHKITPAQHCTAALKPVCDEFLPVANENCRITVAQPH
mmetsp:Transcript_49769/g.82586  ORF Transcript_49769/g.82586 Transcript_49769/m.82586 type:complete len:274 (+) Transcript_49769:85-906(+)|eukprot:CAMPEP_0119344950 /NCGR_PEP_ID=MMETSP1333-20130426/107234_1 /TAXON_ID=418940 /ORGANISM="Scyphosphaera apsteinii, Strain RCC1455" /LENGTH=273 /DNA_ID=CAMNT_0007357401 /DNA_START=82 /DNA_END=903 /DNA_ORIENTATION=-